MSALISNNEFWIALAFVVLVVVAWRPMQARLGPILDGRTAQIKADIEAAERLREEALSALVECQQKQRDALKQAEQIVALARAEAERAAEQSKRDLAATLERRRRLALERIALEEQKAVDEVRNVAADVAVAAAGQILSRKLDAGSRAKLIDETVQNLSRRLH